MLQVSDRLRELAEGDAARERPDLFDLSGVGFHSIQLRIEDKREFNIFFDQAAQHLVQIANRLIDIRELPVRPLADG